MASGLVALVPCASLTATVKLLEPAAVGVPVIVPVLESVIPAGKVPAAIDHW
jgi:hypothetical protein